MSPAIGLTALGVVAVATVLVGFYGLRISRTTSDFYVASRTVPPWWNASAIGGEYLSAASFLGVAGLIMVSGSGALWYPVGYTAGFLMLLLFVAAPLRRSGAYTVPDFTAARLGSLAARRTTSVLVVLIGWLYIIPQLQGAALAVRITTGLPGWVGSAAVVAVVVCAVMIGGMRSITFVQAFQFWLKLAALAIPAVFLVLVLAGRGAPEVPEGLDAALPAPGALTTPDGGYRTFSLLLALLFGTLGLPHVLVRFYTNPDGRTARRTTVIVLGLLSVFYLFPTTFGAMGRLAAPDLASEGDALAILLPERLLAGPLGTALSALVLAGAMAAFLSTTSGLLVSVSGVISQELFGGSVRGFRTAAALAAVVPLATAFWVSPQALAGSVGLVFAFTASTICPLLVLGIWWRRLTPAGAVAGMVTGALACGGALVASGAIAAGALGPEAKESVVAAACAQPAAWTVPLAFAVMVVVSRASSRTVPRGADRFLVRLHSPEPRG
ncbi:cation acetate symporter [Sinomonas cyclohexanicum]|uniref:Cation acetate symporter n=1 Tax=Sinomonas cyclohexanicum TaxID=322009 RepID=A0ABN6FGM5_SINCY|nr:cation acetate symporter [Corynebacterium cyclohexanicum]BCT75695.1 cation acetate symporter [Corynebacterium cyclohexanicum]